MRKLKLIWDFRGPDALKIADHHLTHLKEYISKQNIDVITTGVNEITNMHHIAYIVVNEIDMKPIRDALKPHRGEIYTDI